VRAERHTNLQPLWWEENMAKGDKLMDPNYSIYLPYTSKKLVWLTIPYYALYPEKFYLKP
jgi:hypothetical protein